jgi:hypothetical protein
MRQVRNNKKMFSGNGTKKRLFLCLKIRSAITNLKKVSITKARKNGTLTYIHSAGLQYLFLNNKHLDKNHSEKGTNPK